MAKFRKIEIDFDVHKCIETKRRSFSETPNDVLRRLLGVGPAEKSRPTPDTITKGGWTGKGVTLPLGTQLRMEYRGKLHYGEIEEDGSWLVEGQRFKSPSAAAGGVARTKAGTKPSLDGWKYWYVKRPDDQNWVPLSTLRPILERLRFSPNERVHFDEELTF